MKTCTLLLVTILFILKGSGCQDPAAEDSPFVPTSFSIPETYETASFRLEKLTHELAEMDYDAVMESRIDLRTQFGGEWPEDDFTLSQNLKDIEDHERMFTERTSFAYSVLSLDREKVLGCVYINPIDRPGVDAQVHMWVRTSEKNGPLPDELKEVVSTWLTSDWPFKKIALE